MDYIDFLFNKEANSTTYEQFVIYWLGISDSQ